MAVPGVTQYYDKLNIKVFDEHGKDITSIIDCSVEYNGNVYTASQTYESGYAIVISKFEIKEATSVKITLSYEGYCGKTIEAITARAVDNENYTKVTLYPETIEWQIQRLTDTKQKFIDIFGDALKNVEFIEDFPDALNNNITWALKS